MKRLFVFLISLTAFVGASARGAEMPHPQNAAHYRIGDYYNDGMKEGIVFQISSGGKKGKILSLKESSLMPWAASKEGQQSLVGAVSETDGKRNMEAIMAIADWKFKFPAFAWCASLGTEWYLPSKQELQEIYKNRTLLDTQLIDKITYSWSSTEYEIPTGDGEYSAWIVNLSTVYCSLKQVMQPVRAIADFDTTRPTTIIGDTYVVGDYYNDGTKEGIVFEVDPFGKRGKIVSMLMTEQIHWTCCREEAKRFLYALSKTDGKEAAAKIKDIPDWKDKYPVYAWCHNLGEEWYVPSVEEMKTIYNNKYILELNLPYKLEKTFWTCTEDGMTFTDYKTKDKLFRVDGVYLDPKGKISESSNTKEKANALLAVNTFDCTVTPKLSQKKYKVGDHYSDGVKEGIVFEVTDDGNHGKIVSLRRSDKLNWASVPEEYDRLIGADSETDGQYNMDVVKSIPGWESKYPVFKWCADLGEGWYLPSKHELYVINFNYAFIKDKLTYKLNDGAYWSSTEVKKQDKEGNYCAYMWYTSGAFYAATEKYPSPYGFGDIIAVAKF